MILFVPLERIDDNPFQTREEYHDIPGLAAQIAAARQDYPNTHGLMQIPHGRLIIRNALYPDGRALTEEQAAIFLGIPPRKWDSAARVQLSFGHRRLRAFRHLAASGDQVYGAMPITLYALSDEQMMDAVWRENHDRENLSAVEEAALMRRALDVLGCNQKDLESRWGLSRSAVANRLGLLELPPEIQTANRAGILSERQCQALRPIARLTQLDLSHIKWGTGDNPNSHPIISPQRCLKYIIAHAAESGDTFSSDNIRELSRRMVVHAGRQLYGEIPKTPLGGDGIVQSTCRGCAWRQNECCLHPTCYDAKTVAFFRLAVRTNNISLPVSQDEKNFSAFNSHSKRETLKRAYESNACPHLVIGWANDGTWARPFVARSEYFVKSHAPDQQRVYTLFHSAGLRLGCTHGLDDPCFAAMVVALPDGARDEVVKRAAQQEKFDQWKARGMAQNKRTVAAIMDGLAYVYLAIFPDTARAMLSLLTGESVNDNDQLAGDLARATWEARRDKNTNPVDMYDQARRLLQLAGEDPNEWLPDDDLTADAERWLAHYSRQMYYYDGSDWAGRYRAAALDILPAFDRLIAALDARRGEWTPDTAQLYDWLLEAQTHAKTVCAQTSGSSAEVEQE